MLDNTPAMIDHLRTSRVVGHLFGPDGHLVAIRGGADGDPPPEPKPEPTDASKTFDQAEVDKLIGERLKREREKFADYDDLKKKAEGAATSDERIAALEKDLTATRTDALRRRIQATHKVSDEDAALFFTGVDEEALTAQAKRLAERAVDSAKAEGERKRQGNKVPGEGTTPKPGDDEMRTFTRDLFGTGTGT